MDGSLPILQNRKQKFLEADLIVSGKAGMKPRPSDM